MTFAIEVLKQALSDKIKNCQFISGVINDEDCSDSDREFFRQEYPVEQKKQIELERAVALLTEKQEESH